MPAPPDQLGAELSAALATLEELKVGVREAEEAKAARKAARARKRAGAPGTPRPEEADAVHAGGPTGPHADLQLNEVEAMTPTLHEGTETAAMAAELPQAAHGHAVAMPVSMEPETAVPDLVQLYDPTQSTEVPVHDLEADPLNPMGIKVEDAAAGAAVANNEVIDISDDELPVAAPPVAPGLAARGRPRSCRRLQLEPSEATA